MESKEKWRNVAKFNLALGARNINSPAHPAKKCTSVCTSLLRVANVQKNFKGYNQQLAMETAAFKTSLKTTPHSTLIASKKCDLEVQVSLECRVNGATKFVNRTLTTYRVLLYVLRVLHCCR